MARRLASRAQPQLKTSNKIGFPFLLLLHVVNLSFAGGSFFFFFATVPKSSVKLASRLPPLPPHPPHDSLSQKQCCFNCSGWWGVDWLLAWLNGDNPHPQILRV